MTSSGEVANLVYVGSAGGNRGTLRTRLSDHHDSGGWQTAFRRKVFQYVLGILQQPRQNDVYRGTLKHARTQITRQMESHFAFRCLATEDFRDFEIWLIKKYTDQLWNKQKYMMTAIEGDLSTLESQLLGSPLIPFSQFDQHISSVPDEPGVYMITKV